MDKRTGNSELVFRFCLALTSKQTIAKTLFIIHDAEAKTRCYQSMWNEMDANEWELNRNRICCLFNGSSTKIIALEYRLADVHVAAARATFQAPLVFRLQHSSYIISMVCWRVPHTCALALCWRCQWHHAVLFYLQLRLIGGFSGSF